MISTGSGTLLALKQNGSLWACGANGFGLVGNNGPSGDFDGTPLLEHLNDDIWTYISLDRYTSKAIRNDGTLWAWGRNSHGQIGDGSTTNRLIPTIVGTNTNWLMAVGGQDHTLALTTNNSLFAWGGNNYGQLGDNTLANKLNPVAIGFPCTLASDEHALHKLNVSPNPATDKISIQSDLFDGEINLDVHTVTGQVIFRSKIKVNNGAFELLTDGYSPGIYFISISSGNAYYNGRFIKL